MSHQELLGGSQIHTAGAVFKSSSQPLHYGPLSLPRVALQWAVIISRSIDYHSPSNFSNVLLKWYLESHRHQLGGDSERCNLEKQGLKKDGWPLRAPGPSHPIFLFPFPGLSQKTLGLSLKIRECKVKTKQAFIFNSCFCTFEFSGSALHGDITFRLLLSVPWFIYCIREKRPLCRPPPVVMRGWNNT